MSKGSAAGIGQRQAREWRTTMRKASIPHLIAREGGISRTKYDRGSMREASFKYLRKQYRGLTPGQAERKATRGEPVRVTIYPGKGKGRDVHLSDGRHRVQVAREAGAKHIRARVTVYDRRGHVIRRWSGRVKI